MKRERKSTEVKVHGFENFTIEHAQKAFDVLGKLQSKKYGVEIIYTVRKKEEVVKS
ncbi:hypothetical protein [Clostridium sp.]|uniref:hypothetical protein n=1 Tax=Clostridium sp. TaxID=1506 RepID=UPI0025BDE5B5|nr:hypothetical protein [Clostridium sp.]